MSESKYVWRTGPVRYVVLRIQLIVGVSHSAHILIMYVWFMVSVDGGRFNTHTYTYIITHMYKPI
jgi:hypothetical protein